MADDDLAWDDDEYEVPALKAEATPVVEEEEEEEKPAAKKATEKKGATAAPATEEPSEPLDPVAEKLRLQRLQEASDFESARAAFGGSTRSLEELCPKSEADFTEFGDVLYFKYMRPHEKSANFKAALKTVLKAATLALNAVEMKELESVIIASRNAKLKEEKEAALRNAKKASSKAKPALSKASLEGDLDDVRYTTTSLDDDYDFM